MKGFVGKTALAAAVVVGPIVGISAATADATPVYGGAYAIAYPWWHTNAEWSDLQIANAWGPSNLVNNVKAESARGCDGCNALAVNVQVDLVSYTNTPPNETDTALVDDYGSNDQNIAAAAMFVVTSPGRVTLSGSGWYQLESINWQLRSLNLKGSGSAAVQGEINTLLNEVVGILESDVTTTTPAPALTPAPAVSPAVGTPDVAPAVTPAVAPAASSGIQVTSNIQINT